MLTTFPARWILERLQDHYPEIHKLLTDTIETLKGLIDQAFPGGTALLSNPWQFMLDRLYEHNLPVYYFVSDPENWVKLRIGRAMGLRPGFTIDFRGALTQWLFEKLDDIWNDYRDDLYRLGEKWLRYFWEGA